MSKRQKISLVPDTQTSNAQVALKKLGKKEKLKNTSTQKSPSSSSTDYALTDDIESSQEYSGILVAPLSSFGTFEIEPRIRQLKWINDHTTGEVHKDIPTISMLYNQDLNLPEAAEKFIAQSPHLTQEALWEKTKAIFYNSQPESFRDRAFDVLSRSSVLSARRFISSRTLVSQREIVIQPDDKYEFSLKDLELIDKAKEKELQDLQSNISIHKEHLITLETQMKSFYLAVTEAQFDEHRFRRRLSTVKKESTDWGYSVMSYDNEIESALRTHIMKSQLENCRVRLDPRTKWIHVKFEVVHPEQDVVNISEDRQVHYLASKYDTNGTPEEVEKAIGFQLEELHKNLQKMVKASLGQFRIFGNIDKWKAFTLRVPFRAISPEKCFEVLDHHTNFLLKSEDRYVVWKPKDHVNRDSFHELSVFIRSDRVSCVRETIQGLGSTMRPTENEILDFCSRCFCQDHRRLACPQQLIREN